MKILVELTTNIDVINITINENRIIIDCSSELYRQQLIDAVVINGYENENENGRIQINTPVFFVKNDNNDAYSILKNTNNETFLITKIVILDYLLAV